MTSSRLVVVSNRLPIIIERQANAKISIRPGSGGLVTAMAPVLRDRGGMWMGWLGDRTIENQDELLEKGFTESGYTLCPIDLTAEEEENYYHGFSNEILWPLFHDFVTHCRFKPDFWDSYKIVNRKFAEAIALKTKTDDYIWVQDYHLIRVARELRNMGVERRMGFFLHIPFPSPDLFLKLPWRFEILRGLVDYDLVGFQTQRDRRNFIQCLRLLMPGIQSSGSGQVAEVRTAERKFRVGTFPISIDFKEFEQQALSDNTTKKAWMVHANLPDRQLILGVDRLDYSKGIPNRIHAFDTALRRYPELIKNISFIQVVVPSRTGVTMYQDLKSEIERLVGQVNGRHTVDGWTPIQYIFRSMNRNELVAHYRTCEIALVTPLKDGMNLVAKEYCASSVENLGVLILSEAAGAAAQFHKHALIVNPWDVGGMADAIYQAYSMKEGERRKRMSKLRLNVRRQDIFNWVNSFLKAAIEKDLAAFPHRDFEMPIMDG